MTEPKMIRAKGHGLEIQLAEWPGQGPPILAVHGLTANCRCWDAAAAALAPKNRVLAMDLRGRGLSDKPDTGYSLEHHCRDIEAVLNDLGLSKAVLMGHSLGAFIIMAFAAQYPERVAGLVLVDGGAQLSPEQLAKVALAIKPATDRLGQEFDSFEDYVSNLKGMDYLQPWTEAIETYFRYDSEQVGPKVRSRINPLHIQEEMTNLAATDLTQFYPKVKCPVLALRATQGLVTPDDLVMPEDAAEKLVNALPQTKVVSFKANHYSITMQPNPDRDQAILDFLAEL